MKSKSKRIRTTSAFAACALMAALATGCGSGAGAPITFPGPNPGPGPDIGGQQPNDDAAIDLTLAAGMAEVVPDADTQFVSEIGLNRFGITKDDISRVYRLETPPSEDFSFTLVATRDGNVGDTTLKVGHANAGGAEVFGGPETVIGEGMKVDSQGATTDSDWINVSGDGFCRCNISGEVDKEQTLIVEVPQPEGEPDFVAIEIGLGNRTEINVEEEEVTAANILSEDTIYSSNSFQFGLPAIAVSGDRYSVVAYEGEEIQYDPFMGALFAPPTRDRLWLQFDASTGEVTGNAEELNSWDAGNWRDQEIAALGNVLAVAYTGNNAVNVDISVDRGASFTISEELDQASWGQRLVNIAIAPDYTVAALYWRSQLDSAVDNSFSSQMMLVEGTPTGFDANNTPTGYTFSAPEAVLDSDKTLTPLLMQLKYSDAGDLVIGYGYTEREMIQQGFLVQTRASFRCAVRMFGETEFADQELDFEEGVMPADPNVCLIGSGTNMQIFYAYEKADGIFLKYSDDAGQTFSDVAQTGAAGAAQPNVHAREQGGVVRVDLIYLNPTTDGLELHDLHWSDFAAGAGTSEKLALIEAETIDTGETAKDFTGKDLGFAQKQTTDVAWFGYDSTLDGDDVAVVVHEKTRDWTDWMGLGAPFDNPNRTIFVGIGAPNGAGGFGLDAAAAGATPPPQELLPGMTGTIDAPDPDDANQLKIIVID